MRKQIGKILIIGRIPPPDGGVTVHVSRLLEALKQKKPDCFEFTDYRKKPVETCWKILFYKVIHLHSSHPYLQLLLAILCRLLFKKLIVTFHGNLGRYGLVKNLVTELSIFLSAAPIVLNAESLQKAQKLNRNAMLITAYIPSSIHTDLSPQLFENLSIFRITHEVLFCTNAWKLTFDKHGNEIYGISGIIRNLAKTGQAGLVISDPSGSYAVHIQNTFGNIPDYILFINEYHDFRNVLTLCDAFIRNTTTDGDSLSIYEAIEKNVVVFATDCVTRPVECRLFSNIELVDFVSELKVAGNLKNLYSGKYADGAERILNLYEEYLQI